MQASEPQSLPPSSEQVILDLKGMDPAARNIQVWFQFLLKVIHSQQFLYVTYVWTHTLNFIRSR